MTQLGWGTSCCTGLEWMKQECRRGEVDMENVINILMEDPREIENICDLCNTLRVPNTKQVMDIENYIEEICLEEDTSWFYLPLIFITLAMLAPAVLQLFS